MSKVCLLADCTATLPSLRLLQQIYKQIMDGDTIQATPTLEFARNEVTSGEISIKAERFSIDTERSVDDYPVLEVQTTVRSIGGRLTLISASIDVETGNSTLIAELGDDITVREFCGSNTTFVAIRDLCLPGLVVSA